MVRKTSILLVTVTTLLIITLLIPTPTQASTITQTLEPKADASVYQSNPTTNYGSNNSLRIDGSPIMRAYLRFDLTGLSGYTITAATLKLYANSTLDKGFKVKQVANNTWVEDKIDYNNAPPTGAAIKDSGPASEGAWVSIDVTAYIAGADLYSLALDPLSDTQLNLASKDSGAHAPKLVVTLTSSNLQGATLSSTPTSTRTSTPTTVRNTPTAVTNPPTKTPNTPTSVANTPTKVSNTPTGVSGTPTKASNTPTTAPSTPTSVTSTPTKVPNTPTTVTNTPTKVPNTPTATSTKVPSTPTSVSGSGTVPNFSHVIVMIFENTEYSGVVGSSSWPNFNSLAKQNALLTSSYAVGHPSLPNYIALTSGSTMGITSDCTTCFVNATNIADLVENSGRSWKAYMESMPSACYAGSSGTYAQKHDPFVYYDDIRNNATRCKNDVVPITQLDTDLASNQLPAFAWITPNLCNDAHDCSGATADAWLGKEVAKITQSSAFDGNSLLIITFDEGSSSASCCGLPSSAGGHIATLLISGLVKAGYQDPTPYSHYSLLKTIEKSWGLPNMIHEADTATALITNPWK